GGPPDGASRYTRELHAIGPGNGIQAVNKREHDRKQHAGFNWQRNDQAAARRHQQDLVPTSAVDAGHLVEAKDLEGDINKNSRESRVGHGGHQTRPEEEQPDNQRYGRDRRDLGMSTGLDDDGGTGRTRIN